MIRRNLLPMISAVAAFSILASTAHTQMTDQTARDRAADIVRTELHSTVHFELTGFVNAQRDEALEQSLELVAGGKGGFRYIFRLSPAGYEVKDNAIAYHVWTDVDPAFTVAISPADGSVYRIHGFGLEVSLAEFGRLMSSLHVRISDPDRAESVASFYRSVNPENRSLAPILSLLDLKQAAERQCQTNSFRIGEEEFDAWWKHGRHLYAELLFKPMVRPTDSGYIVEWTVLSSSGPGSCGGAPLRTRLEVGSDARIGKLSLAPFTGDAGLSREGTGHSQSTSAP